MAIKRGSNVETSFGAASMTDLMFLLLVFLMVATTLINSNALKILLPKSANQVNDKPSTTLSVTADHKFYLDTEPIEFSQIGPVLAKKFEGIDKPVVMLNMDKRLTVDDFTELMNVAKNYNFSLFLMTQP